ncbi:hypothetical protein M404DRAFT_487874 [Pisolithus tinctorius Marx 270]|uniref:Uncharacterized protein n=1 Tax=Pisolithus tinctorius Marx 270 TaxID=870435 RepID=A0A0C3NCL6_PISTI|nr:hypothetical protein M404DRAFT_487874 [Pisolithus tinctorius Marx 270]
MHADTSLDCTRHTTRRHSDCLPHTRPCDGFRSRSCSSTRTTTSHGGVGSLRQCDGTSRRRVHMPQLDRSQPSYLAWNENSRFSGDHDHRQHHLRIRVYHGRVHFPPLPRIKQTSKRTSILNDISEKCT